MRSTRNIFPILKKQLEFKIDKSYTVHIFLKRYSTMFNITDLTKKSFFKFKEDTSLKVSDTQLDFKAGDLVQIVKVRKNGLIEIYFLSNNLPSGISTGIDFFNKYLVKSSPVIDPLWNDWSVKSLKFTDGFFDFSFSGKLYYKNKKVGSINNSGNGGPDIFDFDDFSVRDKFYQNLEHYKTILSEKDRFIASEFIGNFLIYMQGLITYEDHLKDIVTSMKNFHEQHGTQP